MQENPSEFKARPLSPDNLQTSHTFYSNAVRLISGFIGAAAIGTLMYTLLVRPWHLHWGATDEEAARPLPGDELLPHSRLQTTRAATINAPVKNVWPWLVQMGQGRGGLYSYDKLENLVGCDIHSVDKIIPDLQSLEVGDTLRLGPEGYPFFTVASIQPERQMVLVAGFEPETKISMDSQPEESGSEMMKYVPESTWAFILEPISAEKTRLIVRLRGDWNPSLVTTLLNRILLEPAHFVMERKMIHGIKERAENMAGTEFPVQA